MSKRGFIFNTVRFKRVKRNPFNLSYENKLTCNMGTLVPFFVQDVLPHDTFKVGQEYLMKAQPLYAPLMHRVDIYQHYFFVPNRLLWNNWEKFITGGESGQETAQHPYITSNDIFSTGSTKLLDYLGYPVQNNIHGSPNSEKMSSLRIRAYNLIYNEFYRDQNLTSEVNMSLTDGHDTRQTLNFNLLNRCWKKDYFTSALPFQQRGPQVLIPNQTAITLDNSKSQLVVNRNGDTVSGNIVSHNQIPQSGSEGKLAIGTTFSGTDMSGTSNLVNIDPNGSLINNVEIPINELRRANALQRWFEKNARAGSRYVEQVLSHFGIHPKDYRLDRPEYLGGGKQPFTVSDVVQTSATEDGMTAQGNQAGKAVGFNQQYVFKRTFEEHGIIIGILSVLPRSSYSQGLNRHLTKLDKFDYAFPEFANLGEQEVLSKELYFDPTSGSDADNNSVFGYQSRYAEYKYNHDEVHGDFRTSLNYWHLGREFDNRPLLNSSFVTSDPSKRVFAVTDTDEDCLLFDFYNNVEVLRCLSAYGTPAL